MYAVFTVGQGKIFECLWLPLHLPRSEREEKIGESNAFLLFAVTEWWWKEVFALLPLDNNLSHFDGAKKWKKLQLSRSPLVVSAKITAGLQIWQIWHDNLQQLSSSNRKNLRSRRKNVNFPETLSLAQHRYWILLSPIYTFHLQCSPILQ